MRMNIHAAKNLVSPCQTEFDRYPLACAVPTIPIDSGPLSEGQNELKFWPAYVRA